MIRLRVYLLVVSLSVLAAFGWTQPASAAGGYAVLNGSGSSWAGPAIDQWSEDIHDRGIVINYSPIGSQQGRSNYAGDLVDFAGSDIAFLNGQDKVAGGVTETSQYGYSYLPITAGGTAFMYHLTVGGRRVTNLRLSGDTITKIFTGKITNWNDPQIKADYGGALPNEPIVPVVRSDGSGATAQFTAWMNDQYESQWDAFCAQYAQVNARPCGETEFYPTFGRAKAQNGSTAAANYVTSSAGEGSINYDEYAYAKQSGFPVVKLLNPGGYYVLPSAANDAVALTKAIIDNNPKSLTYLMQDLHNVYRNTDPRSYPLSSYSYLIVPRKNRGNRPPQFTDAKGRTLSTWANYFLCGGQSEADALGYSPLPINLVKGGLDQVDQIPGAVPTPNRSTLGGCDNPTFKNGQNTLLSTAPLPSPCDRRGTPLNCGSGGTSSSGGGSSGTGSGNGNSSGNPSASGGNSNTTRSGAKAGSGRTATGGSQPAASTAKQPTINPYTGDVVDAADANGAQVFANPVSVSAQHDNRTLFAILTALELLAVALIPPFAGTWLRRRRMRGGP